LRNLTITRRKSFVACAMKDKVYIRDEQAQEIIIDGVPCRKIGDLKNGESKTFPIEDGEQQIFIIADKVSKNYCNATVTIPEGQEDITLSGIHKFYLGSNPFRFDGVQLSEEQLAQQKKNNRKGLLIIIASCIIGFAVGFLLTSGLFNKETVSPKEFQKEDFQITLTDEFEATDEAGFFAFYRSKTAMVSTVREEKELFGNITLEEYGNIVLNANNKTGLQTNHGDGFIWFEYTDTPEGEEIYYLAVCCKSNDAYWIINFATPAKNQEKYREVFLDWAESIKVGQAKSGQI